MRLLALLLLLTACGGEAQDNSGGFGNSFDERAESGLRVRYANGDPPRLSTINALYLQVAACMGVPPEAGPLVVIVQGLVLKIGADGQIYYPKTIAIDAQVTTGDWSPAATNPAPPYIFKHEMVHYLLNRSGFPRDRNNAHDSPFFDSCGH